MMFDRIKSWFRDAGAKSPAREELAAIGADIEAARRVVESVKGRIADLESIIAAGVAAEGELQHAIASPQGAAALAAFSVGEQKGVVVRHVNNAERAAQAAEVAKRALAAAQRDLATAGAEVVRLEGAKKRTIAAILIDHGDVIARRYSEAFRELGEIHDQLVGFARGIGGAGYGANIVLATEKLEVPRFGLPSLACRGDFSTFMTHTPAVQPIGAAALAWSRFAHRLGDDPHAEASEVFSPDLLNEVGRHPEHTRSIISRVRERAEPDLTVVGGVIVRDEERPRRQIKLA